MMGWGGGVTWQPAMHNSPDLSPGTVVKCPYDKQQNSPLASHVSKGKITSWDKDNEWLSVMFDTNKRKLFYFKESDNVLL